MPVPLASFSSVADSLSPFAWPLLAAIVLVQVWPEIKKVMQSRQFMLKVGSVEISAQDASDQLSRQIADLQVRLAQLETANEETNPAEAAPEPEAPTAVRGPAPTPGIRGRVLWVDDKPANNAYEMQGLQKQGWAVDVALTTTSALKRIDAAGEPDVLITDVGRVENGTYDPTAGLRLVMAVRERAPSMPILVYTTATTARRRSAEFRAAGVDLVTGSPSTLIGAVGRADRIALARRIEIMLRGAPSFELENTEVQDGDHRWDFVGNFGGQRIALDVLPAQQDVMRRVRDRRVAFGRSSKPFDELWIVTDGRLPERRPSDIRLLSPNELAQQLLGS